MNFQIKYTLNKKKVTREKEGHSIVIKGSIQQENILTIKIFTCTNRCKLLTELMVEIDNSSIVDEDFNTLLPIMDRTMKQKRKK